MRVAIVCIAPLAHTAVLGGTYSSTLAEALNERGVRAELWTRRGDEQQAEVEAPALRVWRPGFMAWIDVLRAVRKFKPDVVHLQYYFFLFGNGAMSELSTLLLTIAFMFLRTPLVVTVHDVPGKQQITQSYVAMHKYGYPAWLVRTGLATLFAAFGRAARTIVVDSDLFARRLSEYGVPRKKIVVIPHWLLPAQEHDRRAARKELDIPQDSCVVLFFGYATGYKGIEQLLEAFALLEQRDSAVRLILGAGVHPKMGHTPDYKRYYGRIEAMAASLPAVRFAGFIHPDELGKYIAAADAGILPYVEYHGASGPLYYFLGNDRPVLVSEPIATNIPQLHTGVFEMSAPAIADLVDRFSREQATRAAIETESAALREANFSNSCFEVMQAIYTNAMNDVKRY